MTGPQDSADTAAAAPRVPTTRPDRWADLRTRLLSAAVLILIGSAAIWFGGPAFGVLVLLLSAAMIWELALMTRPDQKTAAVLLAVLAAVSVSVALAGPIPFSPTFLLVPVLALALTDRRQRPLAGLCAGAILIAGYGLVDLRQTLGIPALLWLVLIVVASDVSGYFVGRYLGGPKFWPAISPKKTWSGTIAGWLGAGLVGCGFWLAGTAPAGVIALSVVIGLAGQIGDIFESWIKRRCGVKDASALIPGHGGVLDRFDALIGAVVAVMLLGLLLPLPVPG